MFHVPCSHSVPYTHITTSLIYARIQTHTPKPSGPAKPSRPPAIPPSRHPAIPSSRHPAIPPSSHPASQLTHQQPLNRVRILDKRASRRRRGKAHGDQIIRRRPRPRHRQIKGIEGRPRQAAIPIRGVIAEALPHRDGAVPPRTQPLDLVLGERVDGLAVDVVVEHDVGDGGRVADGVLVKGCFRVDDGLWGVVGVVLGVEVGGDDVVA